MPYDPRIHHRRSIRLRGHDYSGGGAYFVTICVGQGESLFGEIVEGEMISNSAGRIVEREWDSLCQRFPSLVRDAFQIMPNHVHAILVLPGSGLEPALARATGAPIVEPEWPRGRPKSRPYLWSIVGAFKSISAVAINRLLARVGSQVWQEDYYEHVIRNVGELESIRDYIVHNPQRWPEDPENPGFLESPARSSRGPTQGSALRAPCGGLE